MKKIIFLLAALPLLAVACTEPELKVQKPTISFEKQGQTLPGGQLM